MQAHARRLSGKVNSMNQRENPSIIIIDLSPHEIECYLCGCLCAGRQGIAIYEDMSVPDNYDGEWGGVSVCEKCYLIMRGMQAERPGQIIARTEVIRVLFKTENRSDNKHD